METIILNDCQLDFVTGPLSVKKKGKQTIENIKIYINRNKENIKSIIFKCVINPFSDKRFKRNGGEMPSFCVPWTPGVCIEPTLLKLIIRLQIPFQICTEKLELYEIIDKLDDDVILAGMNGGTSFLELVRNTRNAKILWPGVFFIFHDEKVLKELRQRTTGIYELPKKVKQ